MQSHPLQSGIHQLKFIMVKHQVFAWMPGWVLGFIAPWQPPPPVGALLISFLC